MLRRLLSCLAAWLAGAEPGKESLAACPASLLRVSNSREDSATMSVTFKSEIAEEVQLIWVDFKGKEIGQGTIMPFSDQSRTTFVGHVFRVYLTTPKDGRILMMEHEVTDDAHGQRNLPVKACAEAFDAIEAAGKVSPRAVEFEALVHDLGKPCVGPSSTWSCVRYFGADELAQREPTLYGIQPNETSAKRAYLTVDPSYVQQIPKIPKVTKGPGYLKMSFTKQLNDVADWYLEVKNASTKPHGVIPGGYTNNDKVEMEKVNLDLFPEVHTKIVREMRQIMEWWTQLRLKHTSTFGVRIYKRGSTLIDHVDRMDTHLASAVLQLDQSVDDDGGWPLEVLLANKRGAEIFLQAREIILYEGAWLRHGRPMRFKGDSFANVFSHFAPPDWTGPTGDGTSDYYGIPADRVTTLADDGVHTSDHYARKQQQAQRSASSESSPLSDL